MAKNYLTSICQMVYGKALLKECDIRCDLSVLTMNDSFKHVEASFCKPYYLGGHVCRLEISRMTSIFMSSLGGRHPCLNRRILILRLRDGGIFDLMP